MEITLGLPNFLYGADKKSPGRNLKIRLAKILFFTNYELRLGYWIFSPEFLRLRSAKSLRCEPYKSWRYAILADELIVSKSSQSEFKCTCFYEQPSWQLEISGNTSRILSTGPVTTEIFFTLKLDIFFHISSLNRRTNQCYATPI